MKRKALTTAALLTTALGLTFAPTIAGADDPPADDAKQTQPQTIDEVTFLGVDTAPMRPEARQALDLAPGTALTIQSVGPGTPADEAGLTPGDVLVRLNDQLIINGQQLAVLVRTFAPGDQVSLHVLRDGKPIELNATLGGRVVPSQPMMQRIPIQPMPKLGDLDALFEQLRGPGLDPFAPAADPRDILDQMQRRMIEQRQEMQQMMDRMRGQLGQGGMQSLIAINDGEHSLQLKTNGQERHLTVKTRDGKLLFEGVVPADGQIEGLPQEVQKKVDDLLKNNRIEFEVPRPMPQQREPLPVA